LIIYLWFTVDDDKVNKTSAKNNLQDGL